MSQEHTVRSYDEELAHLSNLIARMGGLAEAQLEGAVLALQQRDSERASAVILQGYLYGKPEPAEAALERWQQAKK